MAKRKKPAAPKNDSKAAMIVIALFAVIILSVFYFSKKKESNQEQNKVVKLHIIHKVKPHPLYEAVDSYIPNENIKPVESLPTSTATEEPVEITHGSGERIAFIIDDWGQSMANCKYLKEIPEPMAVSILPGLRHTQDVANCAMQNHKLAMLHLPLEALHNNDFYPPNYIIKTTMNPDLASKIIDADLNQLPSIEGVNNHMGSKATEDRPLMRLIFKKIKKRGLFFVDSMTAHKTVCASLADEMDLPFGKRDIFLDNINTREEIIKQIVELAKKAHHRGYAVAIGHDRHLTMQVLKEEIPLLEEQGFKIVSIKSLLKNQ